MAIGKAVITTDEFGFPKGLTIDGIDLSQWARKVTVAC